MTEPGCFALAASLTLVLGATFVACSGSSDASASGDSNDDAGTSSASSSSSGGSSGQPAPCADGAKNGAETDVDCGGGSCDPCKDGKACVQSTDCASGVCLANACVAPSCSDGATNGSETDEDCGGSCAPAKTCDDGKKCKVAADCASSACVAEICVPPSCNDGAANGTETDKDCGGSCAPAKACDDGMKCKVTADCKSGVCSGDVCVQGSYTFTTSGNFVVPAGITSVRVLAVGGGGGGANGHQGGGGSGYVSEGTVTVTPNATIAVTVGAEGTGAKVCNGCNTITGNTPGGESSFGALLKAAGGLTVTTLNAPGANGGSGGGGSCNSGTTGGAGGTNGGNGVACTYQGGTGQGNLAPLFAPMVRAAFTAGAGGAGGSGSNAGGGGGGGVLLNGAGPTASNGASAVFSAKGGSGYGAGGGAGGFDGATGPDRVAGGAGAPGLVYLELVSPQ